ncbi:PEP-CTERM sorting domain-containing protein [Paucibacter sp. Y2R2-4]|uniref:PEP-CTERM sorting domain-containing protein n=1 Tax=Paucibacter sp. Y2R2-4 TaxID=2893553 RepID=UPI0021E438AA|nr:PEP-CTERM sorting domain-containing protein [Paucibacter sp. Y2R2-4]MCV2350357.1 PEP-CTERM sorting domain-containing protein [Paucibacter sp. Y2R2-4]
MQKTLLALALAAAAIAPAQAALTTGDIAFTSFNADEDGWALVAFTQIAAGTKIYFTDNEWNGSAIGAGGAFNTGEGTSEWVAGSDVAAGTVIRFSAVDTANAAATNGFSRTSTVTSGSTVTSALGNSGETVYAYIGVSGAAPTTFLAAITNASFSVAGEGVLTNTGLTVGSSNAIRLNTLKPTASPDYGVYSGVRSGLESFDLYKAKVADLNNWTVDITDGSYASAIPDTTAFTVAAAVPEPQTYAMLLAGLGAIGFVARRRAAK